MRWLRLGLGIAIITQSVALRDTTTGLIGILLAGMAVFNIGCCGTTGCHVPPQRSSSKLNTETVFEEVK
jgi:hypothetical protein